MNHRLSGLPVVASVRCGSLPSWLPLAPQWTDLATFGGFRRRQADPRIGRGCGEHRDRTRAIASRSAGVTHNRYRAFTATCRATYSHRTPAGRRQPGRSVPVGASPCSTEPRVASRSNGSSQRDQYNAEQDARHHDPGLTAGSRWVQPANAFGLQPARLVASAHACRPRQPLRWMVAARLPVSDPPWPGSSSRTTSPAARPPRPGGPGWRRQVPRGRSWRSTTGGRGDTRPAAPAPERGGRGSSLDRPGRAGGDPPAARGNRRFTLSPVEEPERHREIVAQGDGGRGAPVLCPDLVGAREESARPGPGEQILLVDLVCHSAGR